MKLRNILSKGIVIPALILSLAFSAAGCGSKMTSDTITVDAQGNYAYAAINDADYYVVRFYHEEDINADGTIKEGVKPALKQTLQAASGTTGNFKKISKLSFGTYVATIYGLYMDKTTTDVVIGDSLVIGGKLTAPEVVLQNDNGKVKINITDKSFDSYYFKSEANYGFTAEVFTTEDCSGDMVATAEFGADAEYIDPTNSSKAVWIRNRSVEMELENGTYYVRVKAKGNAEAQVEDSDYSEVQAITVDSAATDVKYCTGTFDPATGVLTMDGENMLEFGNGAAMFTEFNLTDDAGIVKDGDLYTLVGAANCDVHIYGSASDTFGECSTCGPLLMPIDKPDVRGTWVKNADGTLSITFMADYQYYVDEADKKTT